MKKQLKYFILLIVFGFSNLKAQVSTTDSLKNLLSAAKEDSTRIRLLLEIAVESRYTDYLNINYKDFIKYSQPAIKLIDNLLPTVKDSTYRLLLLSQKAQGFRNIGFYYQNINDTTNGFLYFKKSLTIYTNIKDGDNISSVIRQISNIYYTFSNYPAALSFLEQGYAISVKLHDKYGEANCLRVLGRFYFDQGNVDQSLINYQKSLSLSIMLKDTNSTFSNLMSLGNNYSKIHNVKKSLEYYNKALALCSASYGELALYSPRWVYNALGLMYTENKDFENAIINFEKGLSLALKLPHKDWIRAILNNLGNAYRAKGEIIKAIECHNKALKVAEDINNQGQMQSCFFCLAKDYMAQNNFQKAKKYSELSRAILIKINRVPTGLCDDELMASQIDSALNYGTGAYLHYKNYVYLRDKLKSEEVGKMATKERYQNEYDRQKAEDKAEQNKKDALAIEEKQKQKIITLSVSAGLLLVLLFAVFVFRSFRQKQKSNKQLEQKNIEIEEKNKTVEEKQKEILDSIRYAKRIQTALITNEKYIDKSMTRLNDK